MAAKAKKDEVDASRFEGSGVSYKAKIIGIEAVPEARGDQMCQDTMVKLKALVKQSGQHKQKIMVNVTLDGLKIVDAISFDVIHTHPVHRISFISRDSSDSRAFGYIYGDDDGSHKFFAIKTANASEQLVLSLRDLFQVVYQMKKKELDAANGDADLNLEEGNSQTSRSNGSTSGTGQTPQNQNAEAENIYQVPQNNAPVKGVANLLELEDQAEEILKSIESVKNLDFDAMAEEGKKSPQTLSPPSSPLAKLSPPSPTPAQAAAADPWSAGGSALSDLAGLQSGPAQQVYGLAPTGFQAQFPPQMQGQVAGGFPAQPNPFGTPAFGMPATPGTPAVVVRGVPASIAAGMPGAMPSGMPGAMPAGMPGAMPGAMPAGMPGGMPGMTPNPFGASGAAFGAPPASPTPDANLLTPTRQGGEAEQLKPSERSKSPRDDMFGDLLDIKKSTAQPAATPKDMFAQLAQPPKKSMNEIISTQAGDKSPEASDSPASSSNQISLFPDFDAFKNDENECLNYVSIDKKEDLFGALNFPPLPPAPNPISTPPPVPKRTLPPIPKEVTEPEVKAPLPPPRNILNVQKPCDIYDRLPASHETHPSPDEPPPPMPSMPPPSLPPPPVPARPDIVPPPPPPRPTSSSSVSSMSSQPSSSSSSFLSSPFKDSDFSMKTQKDIDPFSVPFGFAGKKSSSSRSSHSSLSTSSISSTNQNVSNLNDSFNAMPLDKNSNVSKSQKDPFLSFESQPKSNSTVINKETDPFGLSSNLDSSFKATAKYGKDPFEDSFGGATEDFGKWDPFGSEETSQTSDPWVASPFGAPLQPVKPEGGSGGLLD